MKKIVIDGSQCESKEHLFNHLKKKVDLPEENLDGVFAYFSKLKEEATVMVVNATALKKSLGNYGGSFIKMLDKAQQKNPKIKVKVIYKETVKRKTDAKEMAKGDVKEAGKKAARQKGCPYAGKCGGCNGMKKTYAEETKDKQRWINGILGKLTNVDNIIPMSHPYHYRHKVHAVFSFDRKGNVIAGTYEEKTHRVVNIDSCLIEEQKAGAIIRTIKELLPKFRIKIYDEDSQMGVMRHVLIRSGYATGELLVILVTGQAMLPARKHLVAELCKRHPEITSIVQNINDRKTSMILGERENVLYGKGYIEDRLCGKTFRISAKSFYQVNPEQTETLYQLAVEAAGLTGKERVIDAYCGTGTIGIVAAKHAKEVIGVELNRDAVKDAVINAKINQVDNIRFVQGDAGKFMVEMAARGEHADVVFMDPPRSGSSKEFLDSVVKLAPEKVVYVSCNPETLKDDLLHLMKAQYKIQSCKPVDLFPWTGHVECVVLMSKVQK